MRILTLHNPSIASFRKGRTGRHLTRQHKAKISASLKGRKRGGEKKEEGKTRQERILAIRESEARSRSLRNIGYITNSMGDAVREARLTARFLGFKPRGSRPRGFLPRAGRVLGVADISSGQAARTVRNVGSIGRIFR
ncbi:MAG TPA: hypothetical protein V6C65_04345 [Allocoleopsis sp.]